MKYLITITIFVFLLIGCSSSTVEQENTNVKFDQKKEKYFKERLAKEKFINGSIKDQTGNYFGAIKDFETALNYDSSSGIYFALARDYFRTNKIRNSIFAIQKAIQSEPENSEYRILAANIYRFAQLQDSALTQYIAILKNDSLDIQALYGVAKLYEAKKPSQAMQFYKKILKTTGPEYQILLEMADLSERMGNLEETTQYAKELYRINPSNFNLLKIIIELQLRNKKFDEALTDIEKGQLIYPNDLTLIEYKANVFIGQKEWKKSADEFIKLTKSSEYIYEKKFLIASSYITEFEETKDTTLLKYSRDLLEIIDADSSDWRIKATLGEVNQKLGNDSLTLLYLEEAYKLAEWNHRLAIQVGGNLFDSRKYAEAIQHLKVSVEKFPDDFLINFLLGLSYAQSKQDSSAKPFLKKAVSLNPNDKDANSALAFTLFQLKDYDEAITSIKNSIRIDPTIANNYSMLGMIYDNLEDWTNCNASYEKAISLDSNNALSLNNYAYSLSKQKQDLDKALEMINKALELEHENGSYLDTKGWIYFQMGKYEDAKVWVEKALKQNETNAEVLDHLGDIYSKIGDKEKAIVFWKQALEKDTSLEEIKEKIKDGLK